MISVFSLFLMPWASWGKHREKVSYEEIWLSCMICSWWVLSHADWNSHLLFALWVCILRQGLYIPSLFLMHDTPKHLKMCCKKCYSVVLYASCFCSRIYVHYLFKNINPLEFSHILFMKYISVHAQKFEAMTCLIFSSSYFDVVDISITVFMP